MRGIKGPDRYLPHCVGHEASGLVQEIGPGVTKVKRGDYVVLTWIKGMGLEAPSCTYFKDKIKINSGAITTFNEFSVISENRILKVSDEVSPDVVALLGCAVPTGAGMVKNSLNIKPDDILVIFGVGGVGLSAILYANAIGCSDIIAVDIYDKKLGLAKDFGASDIINFKNEDPIDKIKELTDNKGADFAIESSGAKAAMEATFNSIKNRGVAVIAGNIKKGEKICINPYGLILGKKIIGTWGGETKPDDDIPYYEKLYLDGKLKLDKLITNIYKLENINKAFEDIEKNKVLGRAIIHINFKN